MERVKTKRMYKKTKMNCEKVYKYIYMKEKRRPKKYQNYNVQISYMEIAIGTGLSYKAVRNAVDNLVDKLWITRYKVYDENGICTQYFKSYPQFIHSKFG